MPDQDEIARIRLRERHGAGARYDSAAAPAADLLLARRGTAYFARQLNGLTDAELDPSAVGGQNRRFIIVSVALQARWLARLLEAARRGWDSERLTEPETQIEDLELAASLPAHALRYLFQHSEVHLNVEWRDLPDSGWSRTIRSLGGDDVAIFATPMMRANTIWTASLDLNGRGHRSDLPQEIQRQEGLWLNSRSFEWHLR